MKTIAPARREYHARWYLANKERILRATGKYYAEHKEYYAAKRKAHFEEHQAEYLEWRIKSRDRRNEREREKYRNDPQVRKSAAVRSTNRRISISQRTPAWCDLKAVNEIYKNCPPGLVVDHIIPRKGKLVSGLHVPENLQYLTPQENGAKANKFNPVEFTT